MGVIRKDGSGISKSRNGITITSGYIELGGTLTKNTTISGSNYSYSLTYDKVNVYKISGRDSIGSSFPFWININTAGQAYGTANGNTYGRGIRIQNNSNNAFFDYGFDSAGLAYFTRVHDGPIGATLDSLVSFRVDTFGKIAIGGNLETPSARLHIQSSDGLVNNGPLKFDYATSVLTASGERGLIEVDNAADIYYTPNATRYKFSFVGRNETFSGVKTFSASPIIASGLSLLDANSVPLINFPTTVTSAVNYIQVSNAATGNPPVFSAVGSDPNISITLTPKGNGGVNISSGSLNIGSAVIISQSLLLGANGSAGNPFYGFNSEAGLGMYRSAASNLSFTVGGNAKLTLGATSLTFADVFNITTSAVTGTKIGTAINNKIGFWNAAPIVQPATGGAASVFVANTSGIANDTATWDGYTIGNIVKALRNMGLLA